MSGYRVPVRLLVQDLTRCRHAVTISYAAAEMHARCLVRTNGVTAGAVVAQVVNASYADMKDDAVGTDVMALDPDTDRYELMCCLHFAKQDQDKKQQLLTKGILVVNGFRYPVIEYTHVKAPHAHIPDDSELQQMYKDLHAGVFFQAIELLSPRGNYLHPD